MLTEEFYKNLNQNNLNGLIEMLVDESIDIGYENEDKEDSESLPKIKEEIINRFTRLEKDLIDGQITDIDSILEEKTEDIPTDYIVLKSENGKALYDGESMAITHLTKNKVLMTCRIPMHHNWAKTRVFQFMDSLLKASKDIT